MLAIKKSSRVGSWESTLDKKGILTFHDCKLFSAGVGAGKFMDYTGETGRLWEILGRDPPERQERVDTLANQLVERLQLVINAKKPGRAEDPDILKFQAEVRKEAEEMGGAICGIELLHLIGSVYEERSHSFSEFGDKRLSPDAAVEHGISGKARQEIEFMKKFVLEFKEIPLDILEQGAVKLVRAIWSLIHIEVASILRDVCNKVLGDHNISRSIFERRAKGLILLGRVFKETVRSDPFEPDTKGEKVQRAVAAAEAEFLQTTRAGN